MIPKQAIYVGKITHTRLLPKKSQFRYSYFSLFLDIDKFETTLHKKCLIRFNRPGILSFYNRDHGQRDGRNIRRWVNQKLEKHLMPSAERVFLLSFVRMYGLVFNPFSVYFCYTNSVLSSIVYEVKNTFGEQHSYIFKTKDNKAIINNCTKKFHVSPFIEMNCTYFFKILKPGNKISLIIDQYNDEGKLLYASQDGIRVDLNNKNLILSYLKHPLMTFKIIAAIHFEAFKLWIKGIKFVKKKLKIKNNITLESE